MGSAFRQLCQRYSGTLTSTAHVAIRLWETFVFVYCIRSLSLQRHHGFYVKPFISYNSHYLKFRAEQLKDGAPYRGYGYVPLRFGGNVVRRMGTQQQQLKDF